MRSTLTRDLEDLIARHRLNVYSNTPARALARYLTDCLDAWDRAIGARSIHHMRLDEDVNQTSEDERLRSARGGE